MSDAIRLILNGRPMAVQGIPPTTTVLDWLRESQSLCGTKEGCNEGDCGACTVAVRWLEGDRLVTRPLNACIQLVPMMHGRAIVTVEHLAAPDGKLHPVQDAMARLNGSQCGFCTPGIVMALWAAQHDGGTTGSATEALAGNLCRCTGYGPILAAANEAAKAPEPAWAESEARTVEALRALNTPGPLVFEHDGQRFFAPTEPGNLADLIAQHPDATILGGATDVGLWVTKDLFDPDTIIYTGRVAQLRAITDEGESLWIGAAATYADAAAAIAALYPEIGRLITRIGAAQVRAAGTIGGNIANGSPIGDMPPALIAAGATLILRRGETRREIPLEDFFLDYRKQDRRPGEFVEAIRLPRPAEPGRLRCHKVSKRVEQDITAVLACIDIATEGGHITQARLAYGGMAGIPKRATHAEQSLIGQPFTAATIEEGCKAMETDFTPLTDMRASARYRATVAANLLRRHFIEMSNPDAAPRLDNPAPIKAA